MTQNPTFGSDRTRALDAALRLDSLPQKGRTLKVVATSEQRAAIAERLGLLSLDRLEAELVARPLRGGVRVTGWLRAGLAQACVISFVAVPETIEEPLDRVFLPGREKEDDAPAGAEIFVDLEGDDLPDHFEGPEVDLSEWLIETLSLSADPYPHAPDARVQPLEQEGGADETEPSPFAKLKALKDGGD